MKIIGLTGGIATGKSTVSLWFSQAHYPIIDADLIARHVTVPGQISYMRIVNHFGSHILNPNDNSIDRQRLGEIIFRNPSERKALNAMTHPYIRIEMYTGNLIIRSFPHLASSRVTTYSPETTQKRRLMQRNNLDDDEAQSRINSQMSIERKKELADVVIDNSGDLVQTRGQVTRLAEKLRPSAIVTFIYWWLFAFPALGCYILLTMILFVEWLRCRITFKTPRQQRPDVPVGVAFLPGYNGFFNSFTVTRNPDMQDIPPAALAAETN